MKESAHVFRIRVEPQHLDEMNHVNNAVFVSFLQEAALSHWYAVATAEEVESVRWVAKRHEIDYLKSAYLNDELCIFTWIATYNAVSTRRMYEIYHKEQKIVQAETVWVALDPETLRPKRLALETLDKFQPRPQA
ncbi:acyl-CoA thioesterase [Marinilongibacter aquaticus]|uniref:acyl-CoA thioesterase n=1 Tax=Marinilongibacter aquaticus TaxID=2975157 RepID=UPI0021BD84F9|nr:acyl-CoA thioesterase [Marinilongibacter aquaticus]UBM60849.1 acyl-CoA thioesterase [Marinilongibacter aquaticus]